MEKDLEWKGGVWPMLNEEAHAAICQGTRPGDLVIDATAGNGHDTLFLARLVGSCGLVMAYDVQAGALEQARIRLHEAGCLDQVRLIEAGHEQAAEHVRVTREGATERPLTAVMFNLGFLPGSDKRVITRPETTLAACADLLPLLAPGGMVTIHAYTGHAGGRTEALAVLAWAQNLPWSQCRVTVLSQHNKPKNQEHLLLIRKGVA